MTGCKMGMFFMINRVCCTKPWDPRVLTDSYV